MAWSSTHTYYTLIFQLNLNILFVRHWYIQSHIVYLTKPLTLMSQKMEVKSVSQPEGIPYTLQADRGIDLSIYLFQLQLKNLDHI